jgi:SagB-type dehydrogenase family enzyme
MSTHHRNRDTSSARQFHARTKYVAVPDRDGDAQLLMGTPPDVENAIWQEDWSVEPYPYKVYETLAPIDLPREFAPHPMPALDALTRSGTEPTGERLPTLADLARIALLSNGILKRGAHRAGGEIIEYRAAGGTGARYHLELYFVCGDLPDLPAGIYHYAAHDHSFRQVRAGDFRAVIVDATGQEEAVATAPVVLAMTSTFWRNAWRYKARAYRHAYWDAGTTFANVLALAASAGLSTRLVFGFADREINDLLGIDGRREAALALCPIGRAAPVAGTIPEVPPIDHPTRPVSDYEVEFPLIGILHDASSLDSGAEAAAWRSARLHRNLPAPSASSIPLQPIPQAQLPDIPVDDLIRRRRSTRNYDTGKPIAFDAFSTLLDRSIQPVSTDCLNVGAPPLHDHYLIVNAVEGVAPGAYQVHPSSGALEAVRSGDFRPEATRLAANQQYAGDAHVNSYYLADLEPILATYGNRGYRVAQLLAALSASRLHLATHALSLGAVGSTSYDDEVSEFFAPGDGDAAYLFVVVFGKRRPSASAMS